ncbi:oxidase [Aureimonas leprariae]|uniref:Oxidase n=1 Tax=Plantimonas leprariae TaxID=2615207 RepID=A0A7V7PTC1_9HYPH|nr:oxidase [Aureimonas leprariae]KAB0682969.1 oxidase [Aureimonas leprariae]
MSRGGEDSSFWTGELLVGAGLFVLLGAAFAAAHLPLGAAQTPLIAAFVTLEALLVGVFSMKLRRAPALVLLAAMAGLVFVAALFTMTLTDYPFRQAGERGRTFPDAEKPDAPPTAGSGLPDR